MYMLYNINKQSTFLIPLKEQKASSNSILFEAMHAFNEQYEWTKKTAEVVYNCILKGRKKAKVTFKNNSDKSINGAIVKINYGNIMQTSASIYGFNKQLYCLLDINANKDILSKESNTAINEIWNAITHEFGHANIYLNQYFNTNSFGEAPSDYETWCKVISDPSISPTDILYLYCYALYSTYYQEVQAFVAQTYTDTIKQLNQLYGDINSITRQQFWKALSNTNTYQTYKSNINLVDTLMRNEGMISILSAKLMTYRLYYNEQKILKDLKMIKAKSINALHDAYNNVYYYLGSKVK